VKQIQEMTKKTKNYIRQLHRNRKKKKKGTVAVSSFFFYLEQENKKHHKKDTPTSGRTAHIPHSVFSDNILKVFISLLRCNRENVKNWRKVPPFGCID